MTYPAEQLKQIAEALGVSVGDQAVESIIDSANGYQIFWAIQDELAKAKKSKAELSAIFTHAAKLKTSLQNASPETRLFLERADAGVPLSDLDQMEAWLQRLYDAHKIENKLAQGAAPKVRRDQLWTEFADVFKRQTGGNISRSNPDAPANRFVILCCEGLPGDHNVSSITLYRAVHAFRKLTNK